MTLDADFQTAFRAILRRLRETSSDVDREKVGALATQTQAFLKDHDGPIYLDGYERFGNLGDQALWLSLVRLIGLAGRDRDVRGLLSIRPGLKRAPAGRLMIVFPGGGSLGNRYLTSALRARLIEAWRPAAILQMPVSTTFDDPGVTPKQRLAAAYAAPERTLTFARDTRSRDEAKTELGIDAVLVRDLTSLLPDLRRGGRGRLFLLRKDGETSGAVARSPEGGVVADWEDISVGIGLRGEIYDFLLRASNHRRVPDALRGSDLFCAFRMRAAAALSEIHTARALAFLSGFDEIVTDRLHGVLLARKLGLTGVMLDNDHGKLSRYFDCWGDNGAGDDAIVPRHSLDEALQ